MEPIDYNSIRAGFNDKYAYMPNDVRSYYDRITGKTYLAADWDISQMSDQINATLESYWGNTDLVPHSPDRAYPRDPYNYIYKTEKEKNTMMGNDMIDTLTTINNNYQNDKVIKETLERSQQIQAEREQKKKEAIQGWQDENTYILKWILTKFVKDYKFDWENKAVIVWWFDGVKTHVHCMDGDKFDPEVGFMKCLFKRALGSGNAVKKYFKEKIPEMNAEIIVEDEDVSIEDYVTEELEKRLAKVNY